MTEMNDQMAKCKATMKEVTERIHNFEALEAKTISLKQDLDSARAEKEVVEKEFRDICAKLSDGKYAKEMVKKTPSYTPFAKDFMGSGLKFAIMELKMTHPNIDLTKMKRIYVEEWTTLPDKTKASEEVITKYVKELFSKDEDVDNAGTSSQENQDTLQA